MTTSPDVLPPPNNCLWCTQARNCSTTSFETQTLIDPLPQVGQSITDYLSSLCECGHQLVPSIIDYTYNGELLARIEHTKLCIQHTIKWQEQIVKMKKEFNPE